jgi:hypothetical protein
MASSLVLPLLVPEGLQAGHFRQLWRLGGQSPSVIAATDDFAAPCDCLGISRLCPDISQVLDQSLAAIRGLTVLFCLRIVADGERFLNIYYSFTIGVLKRLSRGGCCLAINPSKR